ncbi:hypothetical protein EGK14_01645 [Erwinia sp. 198]|nr:hypothetical protein EGK14_01645 [Erwinia sp. 198]
MHIWTAILGYSLNRLPAFFIGNNRGIL